LALPPSVCLVRRLQSTRLPDLLYDVDGFGVLAFGDVARPSVSQVPGSKSLVAAVCCDVSYGNDVACSCRGLVDSDTKYMSDQPNRGTFCR